MVRGKNSFMRLSWVVLLANCGRTRWKIENEYNNVLKCRGYNLEHNFGHGQENAADILPFEHISLFVSQHTGRG